MSGTTCECGFYAKNARSYGIHRRRMHKQPAFEGYEEYAYLPWSEITVVDRGFESDCWVADLTYRSTKRYAQQLVEQRDGIRSDVHRVVMHICEVHGETNLCLRPEHLKLGTKSENGAHWWEVAPEEKRQEWRESISAGVTEWWSRRQND